MEMDRIIENLKNLSERHNIGHSERIKDLLSFYENYSHSGEFKITLEREIKRYVEWLEDLEDLENFVTLKKRVK